MTQNSLYAAVSVGLSGEEIIKRLSDISKVELPESVINFIHANTTNFGKAKMILRNNRIFVEGEELVLSTILEDPEMLNAVKGTTLKVYFIIIYYFFKSPFISHLKISLILPQMIHK